MKDFGLDFGLLIAYLAPGSLALAGSSYWLPELKFSMNYSGGNSDSLLSTTIFILTSLMLGMLLSIVRSSSLDRSFFVSLSWVPFSGGTALAALPEGSIEPKYSVLCESGALNAYIEAKSSNKRPYQFYGNAILALVLSTCGYFYSVIVGTPAWTSRDTILCIVVVVVCFFLYLAARNSHLKFSKAVDEINNFPMPGSTS